MRTLMARIENAKHLARKAAKAAEAQRKWLKMQWWQQRPLSRKLPAL
jgi:hypothetical protein